MTLVSGNMSYMWNLQGLLGVGR